MSWARDTAIERVQNSLREPETTNPKIQNIDPNPNPSTVNIPFLEAKLPTFNVL